MGKQLAWLFTKETIRLQTPLNLTKHDISRLFNLKWHLEVLEVRFHFSKVFDRARLAVSPAVFKAMLSYHFKKYPIN